VEPDVSAPGRWIVGPVPSGSTIHARKTNRVVAPGYMWMSGTSFSAPMAAGAAAQILARNPGFSPDQVKGALMVTARHLPAHDPGAGVGEIDLAAAAKVASPPNPNENLYAFVVNGSFDATAWSAHVRSQANWTQANWTAANWTVSNWVSSNWVSSNWVASNWVSANWTTSNWVAANWTVATDEE
jgi:subtilisin family serine protease